MSASKIKRIGILAPKDYRHVLGLTNIRQSFGRSFPEADLFYLEEADIKSMNRLETCDLVILPPSFYGDDTPYKHYLTGRAAQNLSEYAQFGRIASFCSGTYALLKRHRYTFSNGEKYEYPGYVPLIDGVAYGPMQDGKDANKLRVVQIFSDAAGGGEPINLCYDGGPVILSASVDKREDIRPLARFKEGGISVLAQRVGVKGIVVAFSALADIQARDVPDGIGYEQIRQDLERTSVGHDALWKQSMDILESRSLHF